MELNTRELDLLLRDFIQASPPFAPCAIYNPELDLLQVVFEDCSWCEVSIGNRIFELLKRNHERVGVRTHVGFEIWWLKVFLRKHGMPCEGEIDFIAVLNKLAEVDTDARPAILDIAIPMALEYNVTTVLL